MRRSTRKSGVLRRTPAVAFPQCPDCRCEKLLHAEGEVFCLECDWDSIRINAELYSGYLGAFRTYEDPRDAEDRNSEAAHTLTDGSHSPALETIVA